MKSPNIDRTIVPDEKTIAQAMESSRQLSESISITNKCKLIALADDSQQGVKIELPTLAVRALSEARHELAKGNAVAVNSIRPELSIQAASDLLGVSKAHFMTVLSGGAIPSMGAGRSRKFKLVDLIEYQDKKDENSQAAMRSLAAQGQELGMGYDSGDEFGHTTDHQ